MKYQVLAELRRVGFWGVLVRWTDADGRSVDVEVPLTAGMSKYQVERSIKMSEPNSIADPISSDPYFTHAEWLVLHPEDRQGADSGDDE